MCDRCVRKRKATLDQKCGAEINDDFCGRPAVVHFRLVSGEMHMRCDEHKPGYFASHVLEMHLLNPACGLPGASWVGGFPSCCEVAGLNELLQLVSAGNVPPTPSI